MLDLPFKNHLYGRENVPKPNRKKWIFLLIVLAIAYFWWSKQKRTPPTSPGEVKDLPKVTDQVPQGAAVSGEILVEMAQESSPADVAAVEKDLNLKLIPASNEPADLERIYTVQVAPEAVASTLRALRQHAKVASAEQNLIYALPQMVGGGSEEEAALAAKPTGNEDPGKRPFPDDPRFAEQWHLRQIHMPTAWTMGQGKGAIVAILDT